MKTVEMVIKLVYDDDIMYADDEEAKDWFFDEVMGKGGLKLYSKEIGDHIGEVSIVSIKESYMITDAPLKI